MPRDGLRIRKSTASAGNAPASNDGLVDMQVVRDLAAKDRVPVVVGGDAWDFTDFLNDHPGGPEYIRKNAGKDATEEFVASHPVDIIERTLSTEQFSTMRLGRVDKATMKKSDVADAPAAAEESSAPAAPSSEKPGLDACINLYDFEAIAKHSVKQQGWVYYSSGADDEVTLRENHSAFHRIWMRPRVMVNVKEVDMSTTILGHKVSMPMFLSAVAMCKLGHPDGEVAWQKASGLEDIIYMIPTLSGCSFDDIIAARGPKQPMFFQLYVNQDRNKVEKIVRKAEAAGCSALFITCDAPQLGNREKDRRVKVTHSGANVQKGGTGTKGQGTSKSLTTFIDPSLCWDDLPWFKSITDMKIVLKGIATAEDAVTALEAGMAGVLLSNHGGRQLDFARSAIEILPEVMEALERHPKYDPATFEVYIDGGIRRGTDLFKALALGARAVGVGRPALYAMSAHGTDGVQRMIQIMKEEMTMAMRLMGTPSLADINRKMVITDQLSQHVAPVPRDILQEETYITKRTQAKVTGFGEEPAAAAAAAPAAAPVAAAQPSLLDAAGKLLSIGAPLVYKSFISSNVRQVLHRSAVFLILFVVVHLLGNLRILQGEAEFVSVGRFYASLGPALSMIELYLGAAFVAHVLAGLYLTWQTRGKLALRGGSPLGVLDRAKLFFSGVVLMAFLYVHLLHFRFRDGVSLQARDPETMYRDVLATLKPVEQAVFYAVAVALLGVHLYVGRNPGARLRSIAVSLCIHPSAPNARTSANTPAHARVHTGPFSPFHPPTRF